MNGPDSTRQHGSDADLIQRFESEFKKHLLDFRGLPEHLRQAVEYAALGGGKRVRPLLCLRAAQAVGGKATSAMLPAMAVELIHTFSLVHDDLPAMDDDDLRRGRPTLHKHTSEAMAILAGDVMVSMAMAMLAEYEDAAIAKQWVCLLSGMTTSMIAGQVYDTMGGLPDDLEPIERLQYIHTLKTGALIQAAVTMGAVAGRGSQDQWDSLAQYGAAIGLMFQAIDDLLDVTQTTEQMGKQTHKDADAGKLTYPGLLGIDGTRAEIDKLLEQALSALAGFDDKADPLRDLARKLAVRQR